MDISGIGTPQDWMDARNWGAVEAMTPMNSQAGRSVHEAAQEFESYFISYLLKTMRETIPKGFLDRKGEQVWYSFYDQEIGRLAAQSGGIGLTSFIESHTPGK